MSYSNQSEEEKLKAQLKTQREWNAATERTLTQRSQQLQTEKRKHAATKGHRTRERKKAAHGICPVKSCGRTFANVQRHIDHQHPEYKKRNK